MIANTLSLTLLFLSLLLSCDHGRASKVFEDNFPWASLLSVPPAVLKNTLLPSYLDLNSSVFRSASLSLECRHDIDTSIAALDQRHRWAFQMFNAWGRFPPAGILEGTLTDYGDYDQCLGIDQAPLQSEYCLVDVSVPMPPMPSSHNYFQKTRVLQDYETMVNTSLAATFLNDTIYRHFADRSWAFFYASIRVGICLPRSCSRHDIGAMANASLARSGLEVAGVRCETRDKWRPNFVQIVAITLSISMLLVTLASGVLDHWVLSDEELRKQPRLQMLVWFSPVRNLRKLVLSASDADELTCVHGIRFLTMAWIIAGHTLEWNNLNTIKDAFDMPNKMAALVMQPFFKAHYTVETFFYLSGMLTAYVTLKHTGGQYRRFQYVTFLVLRWLRLTPQFAAFLLLLSLLPPMYDGPVWRDYVGPVAETCANNWWINLIYVHNLVDVKYICSLHTWYLSADMQLHWASLLPIVFLLKHGPRGLIFTKLIIVLSLLWTSFTVFGRQFPPGAIVTTKSDFLYEAGRLSEFLIFFYKPWTHAHVFFIGFIFGAFIRHIDRTKKALSNATKFLCWSSVLGGYVFCVLSTLPWLHGRANDRYWSALLYPLNTTLWALVLTMIIWLCITHNGSFVGRILSSPLLRPLSRLTYSVFLIHVWVLWVAVGTRRELLDMSTHSAGLLATGVLVVSYIIALVFTIMFETPVIHLIEYIKTYHGQDNDKLKMIKSLERVDHNNAQELKLLK